ncbi:response regulator [Pigmentibacter ruber]|uniref:response regulator n=1 Tax=Pigmentibacter ruber TaxID=2683196 RepID=UPI00131B6999|nr:response regulator [Pigmentibacter ruber]BFD30518.1 hypothetical protein GTC16762_01360 [Pigmentibacter ruber]
MHVSKLLIVDDSKSVLAFILDFFLDDEKYEVFTAENGKVALEVFEDEKDIECIVMDWEMPVMSGLETLVEIKKINPKMSVIIMSANNGVSDVQKMLSYGANDFIIKPFTREIFLDKVKNVLEKRKNS